MRNVKFYSHHLKCDVIQIDKRKARKLWDKGVEIYMHSCRLGFDEPSQRPVVVGRNNIDCIGWKFDSIVHHNEVFYCDNIRGRYMHFFVKASDLVLTNKD